MRRSYHWTDIDYPLVSQLLDLGGPLHIVPESMIEMKNMQYMIKKDEDGTTPWGQNRKLL